jgi:prevent-host-death family protein
MDGADMVTNEQTNAVGAYDAKAHFSELLERVEGGEEVTITRHGSPVAKLVPINRSATREERKEAIRRWRESSKSITLAGLKIKDLINEGRP